MSTMDPTPARLDRLPAWARRHLETVTRQRDEARADLDAATGPQVNEDTQEPGLYLGTGPGAPLRRIGGGLAHAVLITGTTRVVLRRASRETADVQVGPARRFTRDPYELKVLGDAAFQITPHSSNNITITPNHF